MARIGDYIDAGLNRYDPGDFMRGSALAAASVGQSLQQGVGAITDAIDKRKEYKDQLKTGKELAKAMRVLYPEMAPALEGTLSEMDNEELPLSQRASLGNNAATLINAYIRKSDTDRAYNLDLAQNARADRGMALDEQTTAMNLRKAEGEIGQAEKEAASKAELTQFMARPLLDQALSATAQASKSGERPLIDVDALKRAYNKSPEMQMQIASAALAGLPKQDPVELRNIKFTRDGQATEGTGYFDPKTGSMRLLPVIDGAASNPGLVEFVKSQERFIPNAYSDYKQTSIGYGTKARDGETKITKEEAEKRLHEELGSARREVEIAAETAGLSLNPNQLDALTSFQYNTGAVGQLLKGGQRTPEQIAQAMLLYNKAGGKTLPGLERRRLQEAQMFANPTIQAGAPTGPSKTPTEQALDEAKLAQAQGDIKAKEAELTKQTDMKASAITSARETLQLIDAIPKHPGFSAAVGAGWRKSLSDIPGVPNDPVAGTDEAGSVAQIKKLQAGAFLTAIQQLRGLGALSDAEGKKLEAATANLDPTQKEEDFKKALNDYRRTVEEVMVRLGSGSSPTVSAADRLRAMIPAK